MAQQTDKITIGQGGEITRNSSTGNLEYSKDGVVDSTILNSGSVYTIPSLNIDWEQGTLFTKDISVNSVFTFSNIKSGQTILIVLENNTGGDLTVTWPSAYWQIGIAQTDVLANSRSLFTFIAVGSDLYGNGTIHMELV